MNETQWKSGVLYIGKMSSVDLIKRAIQRGEIGMRQDKDEPIKGMVKHKWKRK